MLGFVRLPCSKFMPQPDLALLAWREDAYFSKRATRLQASFFNPNTALTSVRISGSSGGFIKAPSRSA